MGADVIVEMDSTITLRNSKRFKKGFEDDAKKIVASHAKMASAEMKRLAPKQSGRLKKSISIRQITKTRELGPVEKGLFKTVHPRNKRGGSHSHFTNAGTRNRSTRKPVGKWGTNRGSVRGTNWQGRARESVMSSFRSEVSRRVNKNEDL